jgi:hypothetical protein
MIFITFYCSYYYYFIIKSCQREIIPKTGIFSNYFYFLSLSQMSGNQIKENQYYSQTDPLFEMNSHWQILVDKK